MLYPTNIKIQTKSKFQKVKEKLTDLKNGIIGKINYLIFDRTNLGEKIVVKLHI